MFYKSKVRDLKMEIGDLICRLDDVENDLYETKKAIKYKDRKLKSLIQTAIQSGIIRSEKDIVHLGQKPEDEQISEIFDGQLSHDVVMDKTVEGFSPISQKEDDHPQHHNDTVIHSLSSADKFASAMKLIDIRRCKVDFGPELKRIINL